MEEKIKEIIPKLLRRPRLSPVDSNDILKCPCGNVFGMWLRKHHCRSCGNVFCHICTTRRTAIPELLVEYVQKTSWWSEGEISRVCEVCYQRIVQYETCQPILAQLYNRPHTLQKLYSRAAESETALYAVCYYLSEMKRIQYMFPSEKLNAVQISFLKSNRDQLKGHNHWLTQLLKVEPIAITDEEGPTDDIISFCSRKCQSKLNLGNAVDMVVFDKIYGESSEIGLKMIKETDPDNLLPYINILAMTLNPKLFEILVEKASHNAELANLFYWSLNILKNETAIAWRETLLLNLQDSGIINFRRLASSLEKGLLSAREIVSHFKVIDPLSPSSHITSVEELKIGDSYTRPIFVTYKTTAMKTRRFLYKKEDTRKDACIMKIIQKLGELLKEIRDPFPLVFYKVISLTSQSGLVEIVENCQTLASIGKEGTVSNYLQKHNSDRTIGDVLSVYTISLAFWTIITYIFGVGDRHFDNIMLAKNGILFHIDYGFIFGADPKPYSPKIRLNSYMIEGIGGELKYQEFKACCNQIFIFVRQNVDLIYTLLLDLALADPKIEGTNVTEPMIRERLFNVLFMSSTDEEAKTKLEFLIDDSRDSLSANLNEYWRTSLKIASNYIWTT